MSVEIAVDGQVRHVWGWKPPYPHHGQIAASKHYAGAFGRSPKSKGFLISETFADSFEFMPRVFDQGSAGTCGPHAATACFMASTKRYGWPDFEPSRLFAYYVARGIMHVPPTEDSGVINTDLMLSYERFGVPSEKTWPSENPELRLAIEPSKAAYDEAEKHQTVRIYSLSDLAWMMASITLQFPFIIGFSCPEHFFVETPKTGILRMPEPGERFRGGHDVAPYAYKIEEDGMVWGLIRNSWSEDFGLKDVEWNGHKRPGDFWMPLGNLRDPSMPGYVTSFLAADAWTIHQVEKAA